MTTKNEDAIARALFDADLKTDEENAKSVRNELYAFVDRTWPKSRSAPTLAFDSTGGQSDATAKSEATFRMQPSPQWSSGYSIAAGFQPPSDTKPEEDGRVKEDVMPTVIGSVDVVPSDDSKKYR